MLVASKPGWWNICCCSQGYGKMKCEVLGRASHSLPVTKHSHQVGSGTEPWAARWTSKEQRGSEGPRIVSKYCQGLTLAIHFATWGGMFMRGGGGGRLGRKEKRNILFLLSFFYFLYSFPVGVSLQVEEIKSNNGTVGSCLSPHHKTVQLEKYDRS